jgi:hypothetical protein
MGLSNFNTMRTNNFKENWHKEIIPAGIWGIIVIVLLVLILFK